MNDFLLSHPTFPALGESHSQILKIAQVVKDPGRERGEGVGRKIPIDSPHTAKDRATEHKEGWGMRKKAGLTPNQPSRTTRSCPRATRSACWIGT